jgi:hypothetical protein
MDFLEGIAGNKRVQNIVICWVSPLLIGSILFVIIVLPDIRHAAAVASVDAAVSALHVNKFLLIFIICLVAGMFLSINRLPLWRFLEGYSWPAPLRKWRIFRAHFPQCRWLQARLFYERAQADAELAGRQLTGAANAAVGPAERQRLEQRVTQATATAERWQEVLEAADLARHNRDRSRKYPSGLGWLPRRRRPFLTFGRPPEAGRGRWTVPYPAPADQLLPYPGSPEYPAESADTQIMPTLLGNAMRRMETYAVNNYGLDSQIMWFELLALAPDSLQDTLEGAELEADTIVCAIYTMAGLACTALAGGAWRASTGVVDVKLWILAAASILLAFILHRRLLNLVDLWGSSVKTLVNWTRGPLREKYNLRVPASVEDEKRMWAALTATIFYGSDQQLERELDKYRQPARKLVGSDDLFRRRRPARLGICRDGRGRRQTGHSAAGRSRWPGPAAVGAVRSARAPSPGRRAPMSRVCSFRAF